MSVNDYREFLLSVVNAEDRAESAGTRTRFFKLYRGWFPPDYRGEHAANAARVFLHAYSIPHMWKCNDSLQSEKPKTEFSLHVAILRDKLRFIWRNAAAIDFARHELVDLRNSTFQFRNNSRQPDIKEWQTKTLRACDWLEQNLRNLRVCSNPECVQQSYFVKQEKNQKYCCPECSERGQAIARERRPKVPAKRVLSESARSAIARGQEARWSRYRLQNRSSTFMGDDEDRKRLAMLSDKERIRRFPVGSLFDVSQNEDGQWRKSVVSKNTKEVFKLTTFRITAKEAKELIEQGRTEKSKRRER